MQLLSIGNPVLAASWRRLLGNDSGLPEGRCC